MSEEFTAIDFETANADMASICQVGVAMFRNGQLVDEWKSYVDPDDYFDPINVSIHGIDERAVMNAPQLPQVFDEMCRFLYGRVSVCHTPFDRVAVHQACEKYGLKLKPTTWLDTARVARRAWQQFASRGYGLANICKFLKYEYRSHDALEDAKAAGHVLLAAISSTGLDLEGWLERVTHGINPSGSKIAQDGDSDGPLYGEVIAFTGALQIKRAEAATLASHAGCQVTDGVTNKTTILVVGDQDVKKLAGHDKSSKQRKAEVLIAEGHAIRIVRETDFKALIGTAT